MATALRVQREGRDAEGRTLGRVLLRGEDDLGEVLVFRGVAAKWTGRPWDWCGHANFADTNGIGLLNGPEDNAPYLDWAVQLAGGAAMAELPPAAR